MVFVRCILIVCSAHAVFHGLKNVLPKGNRISQYKLEQLLPGTMDPADDPGWGDMKRVCERFGVTLRYLRNTSPAALINFRQGVYLVALRFLEFEDSVQPDSHYMWCTTRRRGPSSRTCPTTMRR